MGDKPLNIFIDADKRRKGSQLMMHPEFFITRKSDSPKITEEEPVHHFKNNFNDDTDHLGDEMNKAHEMID